jgi:hypothetical protein
MDNLSHWSQRARELIRGVDSSYYPPATAHQISYRQDLWIAILGQEKWEGIFFSAQWPLAVKAIWLAFDKIMRGKKFESAKTLSPRECEAYLRDQNSKESFPADEYQVLGDFWPLMIEQVVRLGLVERVDLPFEFSAHKVFASLNLSEKIQELKSFFTSSRLLGFRRSGGRIELLDVQDFDVYVALDTGSIPREALLDWLQMELVDCFREAQLNLIPEDFE